MKKLFGKTVGIILIMCVVFVGIHTVSRQAAATGILTADQVYKSVSGSIFYMRVLRADGTLKTVGSGFVLPDGKALTAFHVIDGGTAYEAVFDDITVKDVSVLKADKGRDLALLSVDAKKFGGLKIRESPLNYGKKVFALGYPMKDTKIITEGIINTPKANINGNMRILTSVQVASGMSGGPLIDEYGNVAGLISGSIRTMNNIHLCVSAEDINSFIGGK